MQMLKDWLNSQANVIKDDEVAVNVGAANI